MDIKLSNLKNHILENKLDIPPALNVKYIPSLDGLRAFSIILVLISHFSLNFKHVSPYFSSGGFGVKIFFAISGFLITTLLIKEQSVKRSISLKSFYIRRFLRILPVAYLFLLLLLFINYLFDLKLPAGAFLRPFFFVENFSDHPSFVTGHYWSLSVEEQFYLIFPFLLKDLKRYIIIVLLLLPAIPAISYAFYHIHPHSMVLAKLLFVAFNVLGHGMIVILMGSIFAILVCIKPYAFEFKVKYIGLLQLLLLALSYYFDTMLLLPLGLNTLISAVCICLLIVSTIINTKGLIFKILNYKPVRYIGTLSFSIYIWQQMFATDQPWANSFKYGSSVLFNFSALVIVAMVSYHFYELPFLKLKNKFSRLTF